MSEDDNAIDNWKFYYRRLHKRNVSYKARTDLIHIMQAYRREALLERKLAAAQRTIEAQAAQLDQARELLDEALDLNECVMDFKAARAWLKNNPA